MTATVSVEDLNRACEAVGALIAEIGPEHWTDPTPCTDWNVREIVNHLVGMDLVFAAMIAGRPMPERVADRLGSDPVQAYRAANAALRAAFSGPGVLDQIFTSPMGSATGAERLQIRLYDLLAHGWDLSQATGIAVRLPDDLAEHCLAFARVQLADQSRSGRFDEPRPVDQSAPAIDRLVAFLGRTVPPRV